MQSKQGRQVRVEDQTAKLISSLVKPGTRGLHLNEEYEVYVRKVGEQQAGGTSKLRDEKTVKKKYRDTDEIHELIGRISQAVESLETKEPGRGAGQKPLSSLQRKGIEDLVQNGHRLLDDMQDEEVRYRLTPDRAREAELQQILSSLRGRLVKVLSPAERAYYEKPEKKQIKQKMTEVESRISNIIEELEQNQKYLDGAKTPSRPRSPETIRKTVLEPEQHFQQDHYFEEGSEPESEDHETDRQTADSEAERRDERRRQQAEEARRRPADSEEERRDERRRQQAEEAARQEARERELDLIEKVKLLEAMIEQIRDNEKDRKGFVDDQKLKRNIENNLEAIEEIKELYPIESQEDERVQETVLQYEKQLIKMLNKLEEEKPAPAGPNAPRKSVLVNPAVVKKVEAVDNKAIDNMDKLIEEMIAKTVLIQEEAKPLPTGPRKSAVFEQKSIESQYFPRQSKLPGLNDTKSTSDQTNPRKSRLLGLEESKPPAEQPAAPRKSRFLGQNDSQQQPTNSQSLPRKSKLLTIIEAAEKNRDDQARKSRIAPQIEQPLIGQEGRKSRFLLPPSSDQTSDPKQLTIPTQRKTRFQDEIGAPVPKRAEPPKLAKLLVPESESEEEEASEEVYGTAGDFVENVVLNKCRGAITVIKIIKETILAVGYSSGEVSFYSLTGGFRFLSKFQEHTSSVSAMESGELCMNLGNGVSNKEVLLTGGNEKDKTVVVWDVNTFQPIQKLKGHEHMVTCIVDLRDFATVVTGSMDSKVAFWDLRGQEPACIQILEDMKFPIVVMEYDADDGILTTGTLDGQIGIWQVYLEGEVYAGCALTKTLSLECHVLDILRSSFMPKSIITLESDFAVREYDLSSGRLLRTVKADKPIVDIFIVEANGGRSILLFAIDNACNIHRIKDFAAAPPKVLLPKSPDSEVQIKRYIGYNPKSQIFINKNELLLLTADQTNQTLSVNKLNLA